MCLVLGGGIVCRVRSSVQEGHVTVVLLPTPDVGLMTSGAPWKEGRKFWWTPCHTLSLIRSPVSVSGWRELLVMQPVSQPLN